MRKTVEINVCGAQDLGHGIGIAPRSCDDDPVGIQAMAGKLRLDAPDKGLDRVSDIPIRIKWIKDKTTAWRRNENACPGLGELGVNFVEVCTAGEESCGATVAQPPSEPEARRLAFLGSRVFKDKASCG